MYIFLAKWGVPIAGALIVMVAICFGLPMLKSQILHCSDSELTLWLYVVGALFALVGCFVGIYPPKSWELKTFNVIVFLLIFFVGYLVTNEQGKRAQAASDKAEQAQREDANNKVLYDRDLAEVRGKLSGIELMVKSVSKGSADSAKWQNILYALHTVQPTISDSGNLKKRVSDLADQVLRNLYRRGWRAGTPEANEELQGQPLVDHYPHGGTQADYDDWSKRCVQFFEIMQLKDVRAVVNEMAQLHIRDTELDETLNSFLTMQNEGRGFELRHPEMVFEIGQRMKMLAEEIP